MKLFRLIAPLLLGTVQLLAVPAWSRHVPRTVPAALASLALVLAAAGATSAVAQQAPAALPASPPATPRAVCGPGSVPEPGIQGRVPVCRCTTLEKRVGRRLSLCSSPRSRRTVTP